jgi:predicted transcriptional regulator
MSSTELKSKLHQIIDKIEDDKILQAVHTLLEGRNDFIFSADRKPLSKKEVDLMLSEGEQDIKEGRVTDHKELMEEIKTWRKK